MKKIINLAILAFAWCMFLTLPAYAASAAAIMETYTGESDLSVYIKGTDLNTQDISVQIATSEADKVHAQLLEELDMPMQTLVIVDNSLSITAKNQKKIETFLQNLIADRLPNEEMSLATFSEEVHILVDYTSEYEALMRAADSISYQRQSTYLTDALYDLITAEYLHQPADIYRRIIIISDGVDNKSIGYTKEELYSLIKDTQIPIYTIGCKNKSNNEELENMFALSRMTHVDYFLLDKVKDLLDLTSTFKQDRSVVKLTITPPASLMDGSKKAVRITFPNHSELTAEIMMPQHLIEKIEKEQTSAEEEQTLPEKKETHGIPFLLPVLAGSGAVLVILAVLIIFIRKRKNRQQEPDFEQIEHEIDRQIGLGSMYGAEEPAVEQTEKLPANNDGHDDGSTFLLWNQNPVCHKILLTDIHASAKSFQVPIEHTVLVGRKAELCDIALTYDRSVSGQHCEISTKNGAFFVKDLNSANGTCLNGSPITAETEIHSGDILKLGRLELRFDVKN